MKARFISLSALFTALYAVGVIVLAPISFGVIQCRVADALIALSTVFGWPVIIGVTLGCIAANLYGGLGLVDVVGGSLANFLAAWLGYIIAKRFGTTRKTLFIATLTQSATIGLVVGGYLWILFNLPAPLTIATVLAGSLISICGLGNLLISILKKAARAVYL